MIDSHNWAAYSNPGPGRGAGGWRQGLAATTQTISTARLEAAARPAGPGRASRRRAATHSTAGTTGVEGAGGSGGHGRASRSTTPSLQARVWRSRGRPGPTAPGTPAAPQAPATRTPGHAKGAGTEVPAPCRLTQPLPRRGLAERRPVFPGPLRPNDRQSWRRRRIHRNMPPTTAAPRPAPPIRPSKPVRARPFFGLVAGTSGAT